VFVHPHFGAHLAFLQRMADRGALVAAGPLPEQPGSGIPVLRMPADLDGAAITALASTDDRSVRLGLFTVDVQPWDARFHG
jgi:uncharacterized protein YciI